MIRHLAAAATLLLGTACGVQAASEPSDAQNEQAALTRAALNLREAMRRVMVQESMAHADNDRRATAAALSRIDASGTPAPFREAWQRHVAAQVELANLAESSNSRETAERLIRAANGRSEAAVRDYTEVARRYGALSQSD